MKSELPFIKHKGDLESAKALVNLEYPAIKQRLGHMLEWTADSNWPVASVLSPYLSSMGEPIVPEIHKVLDGNDLTYKYFCISNIISFMPQNIAEHFRMKLERLADNPTKEEIEEELHEVAQAALEDLNFRDMEEIT